MKSALYSLNCPICGQRLRRGQRLAFRFGLDLKASSLEYLHARCHQRALQTTEMYQQVRGFVSRLAGECA